jgi:hypothetical protein
MQAIVLADDDLRRLERQFGPEVRQMGCWNSDGVFGYASIPISAVEQATEDLGTPGLFEAVSRLKSDPAPTNLFLEMVQTYGPGFIVKIKAATFRP